MPRNRFSAPRPRKLILAVHSKTISQDAGDKAPAPRPFRACVLIRGAARAFISSRAGGAAACLFPGGAVSAGAGVAPLRLGVREPRAGAGHEGSAERVRGAREGARRSGGERLEEAETPGAER